MAWRKVLYERQDYPDNYSGEEFLKGLRKNVNAKIYSFSEAVNGSLIVMQQITCIVLFWISFVFLQENWFSWDGLLMMTSVTATVGFLFYYSLTDADSLLKFTHIRTVVIYLGFGYGMSPIFKTLTETISTDTIFATATGMFLLNLIFHNYGVDVAVVSPAFSFNAAIFGAVCLTSRLTTDNDTFALLTFAVVIFALWPLLRIKIWEKPYAAQLISIMSGCLAVVGLYKVSHVAVILFLILNLFVVVICPTLLILLQPLKNTIHGPWDEAVIKD